MQAENGTESRGIHIGHAGQIDDGCRGGLFADERLKIENCLEGKRSGQLQDLYSRQVSRQFVDLELRHANKSLLQFQLQIRYIHREGSSQTVLISIPMKPFHRIALVLMLFSLLPSSYATAAAKPKLILAVVLDQFRYDYLTRFRGD